MRGYLLDTHALIWWFIDDARLGRAARNHLIELDAPVFVSAATAFELATKHRIGKLPEVTVLINDYAAYLAGQHFVELAVRGNHALAAGRMSIAHRDPFDRMLIAQAQLEGLTLVSNERLFDRFGVIRLWD